MKKRQERRILPGGKGHSSEFVEDKPDLAGLTLNMNSVLFWFAQLVDYHF